MIVMITVMLMRGGFIASDGDIWPAKLTAGPIYNDTCDFSDYLYNVSERNVKCGDKCINWEADCFCGSDIFRPYDNEEQCCITSKMRCTKDDGKYVSDRDGVCSQGKKLPMSIKCDNPTRSLQCHNSYQDSKYVGERSHFTCPQTCVSVLGDMCRGVDWCGSDIKECGPQLRCYAPCDTSNCDQNGTKFSLNSSAASGHHYCYHEDKNVPGKFDSFDRTDEIQDSSLDTMISDINLTQFHSCVDEYGDPGVMCGVECRRSYNWCIGFSVTRCGPGNISVSDARLCGNPHVWANVSCTRYYDGPVWSYGQRCTGSNQECIIPWYLRDDGDSSDTCSDRSDQIFTIGLSCSAQLQQYKEIHDEYFCNSSIPYSVKSKLICTNKTQWLSEQSGSKSDPHRCQRSCSSPGPDCVACSNPKYYNCTSSNKCLHPDLVCDNHPQCPGGEDEDLKTCHEKKIKNKIFKPYASLKCRSPFYENMDIYATPCNGIKESVNGLDELRCGSSSESNKILGISSAFVALLIVVLRYHEAIKGLFSKYIGSKEPDSDFYLDERKSRDVETFNDAPIIDRTDLHIHQYRKKHEEKDTIERVNVHLMNIILSEKVTENVHTFNQFYDLEMELHGNVGSEIHRCLKRNLDPVIVENILDAKFPGCMEGCRKYFRKIISKPIFKILTDKITKSKKIKESFALVLTIIKIEGKYIDLYKDIGLTLLLLRVSGGFDSIADLPENFTSVMVVIMLGSILLPLTLSSLHLAVNNPFMILRSDGENSSKMRKILAMSLCFLLSATNPVFLESYYDKTMKEARKLFQNYKIDGIISLKKCKTIQWQAAEFLKIEHG